MFLIFMGEGKLKKQEDSLRGLRHEDSAVANSAVRTGLRWASTGLTALEKMGRGGF